VTVRIITGDALEQLRLLPDESVHMCVTSPPYYGLRDYGTARWEGGDPACSHRAPDEAGVTNKPTSGQREHAGRFAGPSCQRCGARRIDSQIGLEPTPDEYIAALVAVFRETRRVLRPDGTLWLNIGDSYHNYRVHKDGGQPAQGFHNDRHGQPASGGRNRGSRLDGIKEKDLIGIPWMLAFALRADGWYLRQDIIWSKPNPMPESVQDRCTKAHEYLFLLSKSERYWFDAAAIAESMATSSVARLSQPSLAMQAGSSRVPGKTNGPMRAVGSLHMEQTQRKDGARWRTADGGVAVRGERNKRSVWEVATKPFSEAHFATFPPALIEPCILAGCPRGGTVLDPFGGAGTTGLVADRLGRSATMIELNPEYAEMARRRIANDAGMFATVCSSEIPPPQASGTLFDHMDAADD